MNINTITDQNKCMSCGGCSSVCPSKSIKMCFDADSGFYRPVIDQTKCTECGLCYRICPANNQINTGELLGKYNRLLLAHSNDKTVRHFSTSGGVVNSLIRFLIDKKIVDGVLMAGYDGGSPIETSALLITQENAEDLLSRPRDFSSRYVSVPVLEKLSLFKKNGKYAVVGTPCQINALNSILKIKKQNIIKIGITCSGGMSYLATSEYKRKIKYVNSKMYYRGDGWPGFNCVSDGSSEIKFPHLGSYFERMFSSQIFKNKGCRFCKDHFAESADISFCDFWNKDEIKTENEGKSCVIIRSSSLNQIIDDMVLNNYVTIDRDLSEKDVTDTQIKVLKSKKGNLSSLILYRFFLTTIDIVFRFKIYKAFNIGVYRFFCKL